MARPSKDDNVIYIYAVYAKGPVSGGGWPAGEATGVCWQIDTTPYLMTGTWRVNGDALAVSFCVRADPAKNAELLARFGKMQHISNEPAG